MRRVGAAITVLLLIASACADVGGGASQALPSPTPSVSTEPTPFPDPSPAQGRFRFLAIGDFGSGSSEQREVAARMCRLRDRLPYDLVVTTGDNVYDSGHQDRFDAAFFEPYSCLLEAGVRFRSTLGNHDIVTNNGRPELNEPAFGFKARNYVVRRAGIRFVMADSNSLRLDWLREALRPDEGDRWTIVVFHHPVYSSGVEHGSTPGFSPMLPRLFRKRGVDLVLNGHDHNYEASRSLRRVRYLVTGGGGASVRACGPPVRTTAVCIARYHFLEIVVGSKRIAVRAIPRRGRPFHTFTTTGRG